MNNTILSEILDSCSDRLFSLMDIEDLNPEDESKVFEVVAFCNIFIGFVSEELKKK
ncbi:MAG: hypothetical protein RR945_01675 [Erysipelotrichaceae bacterium]